MLCWRTWFLKKTFAEGLGGFGDRAGGVLGICKSLTVCLSSFAPHTQTEMVMSLRVGEACVNCEKSGSHASSLPWLFSDYEHNMVPERRV